MLPAKWYQTSFLQACIHGNEDDGGILYKHLKIQLLHIKMLNKTMKNVLQQSLKLWKKKKNHNKEINNLFHETELHNNNQINCMTIKEN